ncbi:MAG: PorV/PorQ family protein [bacterium]
MNKLQITNDKQFQNTKFQYLNKFRSLIIGVLVLFGIWCLGFGYLPARADGYLSDPTIIGVGARPLGMGKAYVAVAEDGDAVFTNPAGIARAVNPKLTSMYTSLMGDVSYLVVGGVYPMGNRSAVGAGLINSRVSDITLTDSTGLPLGSGSWGNTVLILSYGTYLNEYFTLDRDIPIGASLKYFSVGGEGTGVSDASGSGFDLDLGVLYPVNNYLTLGANAQNILPSSIAKITKSTGSDGIPATIKVGAKVAILGKEGEALVASGNRKLYGNIDYDYNGSRPGVAHYGLELWPVNNLALRAGFDDKDLTAGIGFRVAGVEFNYAYHPYSGINENTTQYFSIGYLGEPRQRELKVKLDSPADKSVVYSDNVTVSGKIEIIEGDDPSPAGLLTVRLNDAVVPVNADNTFSAEIPLSKHGKNLVTVIAADSAGNTGNLEARLVRLTSFADVPEGYWAKLPIENNATVGMVNGYPDGTFRPNSALTRAELATLLVRAKGIKLPATPRQVFKDVKKDFWAAKYIEVAQKEGLVKGYPDKTFRPNNKINKVEGIAVMVRFDQLKLADVDAKPYWDVSTSHWAAKHVQAAKEAGMLSFTNNNRLLPKSPLARSQAVEMLGKTSLAGGKIKDLYSWEKGFKPETTPINRPQIKASIN